MVRLLSVLDKLDLEQVRRTGERARAGLEQLARDHREILRNVRGAGVMLGFDVARADLSEALLDRAFRRGLLLLPAGERSIRFYPRYDSEPAAVDEALAVLRLAVEDLVGGRVAAEPQATPKIRVGTLEIPVETIEIVDLLEGFDAVKPQVLAVEQDRYGVDALLQLPLEALEATAASAGAIGLGARDRVSGRLVGYLLGSALENHDELGVSSDPHFGENNTFYLQAMAVSPSVQNQVEVEAYLLDALRTRASAAGFEYFSTLIEDRLHESGPGWIRGAAVLEQFDNYLGSGTKFSYLQAPLRPADGPASGGP
jgi:hypothetical protein